MTQTVLITGASRGIGAAAARLFGARGWRVGVHYCQSRAAAETLCEELRAGGADALPFGGDLSDPAQARAVVEDFLAAFRRMDALVCCAGVALGQMLLTDVTDEQWRRLFAVDVDGVFYPVRAALPQMVRQRSGSIVTVSSMWGQVGASCEVAYSAAKGAVIAFSRALAKETGPSGVRVNCVCPGVIQTGMNAHLTPEDLEALRLETPLERIGTPEEAAEAICFLAGPESRFVTGQVLGVNGGMVI